MVLIHEALIINWVPGHTEFPDRHRGGETGPADLHGDCQTNVCFTVPEKPADTISEVLNFPRFAQIIDCSAASE